VERKGVGKMEKIKGVFTLIRERIFTLSGERKRGISETWKRR